MLRLGSGTLKEPVDELWDIPAPMREDDADQVAARVPHLLREGEDHGLARDFGAYRGTVASASDAFSMPANDWLAGGACTIT